jgi:glycosyltransferase involved in cell wall biosynthesis
MNPVKVLFPYVGDSVGGSHVSSLILAQALPAGRYVPVVASHEDGPLSVYLESLGIVPERAPQVSYAEGSVLMRNLRRALAVRVLARFIIERGIGLVHTHDLRMHMIWGPAARVAGVPHVWHQRTPAGAGKHARAALKSDALIAVSAFTASSFPTAMRAFSQIVFNPFRHVDPPDRAAARLWICERLSLPSDSCFVCFVANLAPRKRPLIFVQAAAALAAQGFDNLYFLMLGDRRAPYDAETLAAISAAGLEGRCHLLGMQRPIDPWVAGSDLLIAPAIEEAFGRTLVEAQLQGTPVIASNVGGHCEIVTPGKTGELTPPDDPEAMAAAAARLLSDPEQAARLAQAARNSAAERFSLDRHLSQVLAIYDRVIG